MSPHVPAWWDEVALDEGTLELRVRAVEGGVRVVADGVGRLDVVLPPEVAVQLAEALRLAAGVPGAPPLGAPAPAPAVGDRGRSPDEPGERSPVAPTAWSEAPPHPTEAAEALDELLAHVRRLSRVLPETAEIDTLGDPTFRVSTRIFAVVETVDDVPVLRFKATFEEQAELLGDPRFRADPDTGHHGWTSLRADRVEHPAELDRLLLASYRLVAPADAVVRLDEALASAAGASTDLTAPGPPPSDGPGA